MKVYFVGGIPYSDELYHHGIKGQHWGVRKYQYEDGKLTALGRQRYQYQNIRTQYTDTGTGESSDSIKTETITKPQMNNSPQSTFNSGQQYATTALTSMKITNTSPGSQVTVVQNGKTAVQNTFSGFTMMKTNEGLSTSAIREALEKKRVAEKQSAQKTEKAETAAQETSDTTDTSAKKTTTKKTTNTATKAAKSSDSNTTTKTETKSSQKKSASKATKKKTTKKKTSKKNSTIKKTTSVETNNKTRRTGPLTKAHDLKFAGNGASNKIAEDYLKQYRINTKRAR